MPSTGISQVHCTYCVRDKKPYRFWVTFATVFYPKTENRQNTVEMTKSSGTIEFLSQNSLGKSS